MESVYKCMQLKLNGMQTNAISIYIRIPTLVYSFVISYTSVMTLSETLSELDFARKVFVIGFSNLVTSVCISAKDRLIDSACRQGGFTMVHLQSCLGGGTAATPGRCCKNVFFRVQRQRIPRPPDFCRYGKCRAVFLRPRFRLFRKFCSGIALNLVGHHFKS